MQNSFKNKRINLNHNIAKFIHNIAFLFFFSYFL